MTTSAAPTGSPSAGVRLLRAALSALPSPVPRRQRRLADQHALVDGIPYTMPVNSNRSPVLMAAFPMAYADAVGLLPGTELHPFRLGRRALFVVTVVNYLSTDIGAYIEYSLAVAVTHGAQAAPPLLPGLAQKTYGLGQFVVDLPVSSEVSVKGGKGIWGMPKHQASLDFVEEATTISARYEDGGALGCHIEILRPPATQLPLKVGTANYCAFRGLLMKSFIYFEASADVAFGARAQATLRFGDAPGVRALRGLDIDAKPVFTAYLPDSHGVLDDYFESWFLTAASAEAAAAAHTGDTLRSVVDLTTSQDWLEPPRRGGVALLGSEPRTAPDPRTAPRP
jgi:hypothetical protein